MKKPVLGAVVAMLSGWVAACIYLRIDFLYFDHDSAKDELSSYASCGFLIMVMSWVLFRPLYLKVPRNNFLWNPLICVPLGALAGFLTMIVMPAGNPMSMPYYFTWWYIKGSLPGAIVGATIWLVGTLTYCLFNENTGSPPNAGAKYSPIYRWLFIFSITSQLTLRGMFFIKKDPFADYAGYNTFHHPICAIIVFFILNSTGLFLIIYTPRFFQRLGPIAILAWLASVLACVEIFFLFLGAGGFQ